MYNIYYVIIRVMLFFISTLPGELISHFETAHVESKRDFFIQNALN